MYRISCPFSITSVLPNDQSRPKDVSMYRNYASICGEVLLVRRPNAKLKDRPLSAVRGCLFNIIVATFHIGSRSSIRNLRTRRAVLIRTHLSWIDCRYFNRYVEEALIAQTNLVWAAFTSYVLSVSYAWSSLSGRVVHCWNNRVYFYETSYWFQFFSSSRDFD
jgi:hypothetical protein